jgi:dephospho-CoA kinase
VGSWPGKYVIGLTGNIATGKSVVRKMLEHLGAYSIDADALSHRAIAKGAPGYPKVIDTFGKWIVDGNGEIDRTKLGRLVFNDPEALQQLEGIVHPLVEHAVDLMIQRANQRVIVIEAIKLLESKLVGACDTVWTTYAPETIQKARLMQKRKMSEQEALQRIHAQSPQAVKAAAANVVIQNSGSLEDTWKQVVAGWKAIQLMP